ncbi:MAG: antibiotic biosynthesis monooxygenase [Actinobacteria bacterium]|nr:antibiotic biosynthesis monooxygenase [Actinomycetota bacterium]
MVIESAQLPVITGREEEFERAMVRGREILEGARGSGKVVLGRGVESPSTYVLLVEWESVEAHREAMKQEDFAEFREILRSFYDGNAIVAHFTPLHGAGLG